jgi:hypothetical protein
VTVNLASPAAVARTLEELERQLDGLVPRLPMPDDFDFSPGWED